MAIQDVVAPTSRAIAAGTATVSKAIDVSGASAGIAASSATPYRVVSASGASAATVAGTATAQRLADATGASAAIAAGAASASAIREALAESAAIVYSSARYDGEARDAWAMNVETSAIGSYTGFDFNSFATIGGRTFGFSDDGVFEITGSSDAGQPIPFFLASESFSKLGGEAGIGMLKPHTAYVVGALPDGEVDAEFFVTTDEDETYSYPLGTTGTRLETVRALLGRGLRSRFLRYGIVGKASGAVELASITVKAASSARNV